MTRQAFDKNNNPIGFAILDGDYVVTTPDTIEELSVAASQARQVVSAIDNRREQAIREATRVINEQFRDELRVAHDARHAAEKALEEAKIEQANQHPMTGKRITRQVNRPSRWSSRTTSETHYGVVEVVSRETVFPANMRYLPQKGELIVRLERKDGSTGTKFERIYSFVNADTGEVTLSGNWKVVEEGK